MVAAFVKSLEKPISAKRLEAYREAGADDLEMIVNYFYNIELSEALYASLQVFEIALRNSIHAALTDHFGTEYWFDRPGLLLSWQSENIKSARSRLTRASKDHEPGRIIALQTLGFWHSMFNRPYEKTIWRLDGSPVILLTAFPDAPKPFRTSRHIWTRIDEVRALRNRVFHYEPIWNWPDLAQRHRDILETIRWISADMYGTIGMHDRFIDVARNGKFQTEQKIRAETELRDSAP